MAGVFFLESTMSEQLALTLEPDAHRRPHLCPADRELITRAIRCLEERYLVQKEVLTSPEATRDFLKLRLDGIAYEVFALVLLDNRHSVLRYVELFRGTLDGASVHPREVLRCVMEHNAAAVILAHNHPSGVTEPSQADIRITHRLKEALALVDVRVLDHFIVGQGEGVSLAERGLL
jgi:DNA repair protein RadC